MQDEKIYLVEDGDLIYEEGERKRTGRRVQGERKRTGRRVQGEWIA